MHFRRHNILIATAFALIAEMVSPSLIGVVQAAPPPQFVQAFVRLNRHEANTETGGTVCATPSATDTASYIEVQFPTQSVGTDFTVGTTASNWTVTTTNLPSLVPPGGGTPTVATAWPGIGTALTVTGKTVRFPSNNLVANTYYCFNFAQGTGVANRTLKTGGVGYLGLIGYIETYAADGTTINERTNYATAVIANDQVVVSAVVPPSFNFTLSGNTDAFTSNLDPSNIISTTGVSFSIITNAKGGWISWIKDQYQGLYSATASYTIPTSGTVDGATTTLVANGATEGYVLDSIVTTDAAGGCTVAPDSEYDPGGLTDRGGTLSANFQPVASCTGTAPATSNGDTVKLLERATIAGGTPAGSDYSDVITVVGAGNF